MIAREIADIQAVLLYLAKDKTEQRYLATIPTALPDVRKGVRIQGRLTPAVRGHSYVRHPFRGHLT